MDEAKTGAITLLKKLRGSNQFLTYHPGSLEDRLLVVTSAGNTGFELAYDLASLNNPFAAADLLELTDPASGQTVQQATDVLVVENRTDVLSPIDGMTVVPSNLDICSQTGGDISAPGASIYTFGGPVDSSGVMTVDGTSFASPEVAGVAAYMMALNPTLKMGDLRVAVLVTAAASMFLRDVAMLDAYAAILATERE